MFSNFSVLYRGVKFLLRLWSFTTLQTFGSSVLSYLIIIILILIKKVPFAAVRIPVSD